MIYSGDMSANIELLDTTQNISHVLKEWNTVTESILNFTLMDTVTSNTTGLDFLPSDGSATSSFGRATKQLHIYFTPVIVFVGIVTNILSFCVFVMTHLRLQSSSVYLAVLALSDTGFLFALFLSWFSWIKIHLVSRPVLCQLIVYLTYVCSFVSVYSVVAFTCERFIAVLYPFHRKRLCTKKNATIVEGTLILFGMLFYSFPLWTSTITNGWCLPMTNFLAFLKVMIGIDTVITLFIPSVVIIILNICISYAVVTVMRRRNSLHESQRTMTGGSSKRSNSSSGDKPIPPRKLQKQRSHDDSCMVQGGTGFPNPTHRRAAFSSQMRTTRMLLIVSTVFVLLSLPSHAYRFHAFVTQFLHSKSKHSRNPTLVHWQELFEIIHDCNFATNFFLYSVTAKSFREALRRLLKRFRSKCHKTLRSVHNCLHCVIDNRQNSVDGFAKFNEVDLKNQPREHHYLKKQQHV